MNIQAKNQSLPCSYTAGLHQVWMQITVSAFLTQEEILEKGGSSKEMGFLNPNTPLSSESGGAV